MDKHIKAKGADAPKKRGFNMPSVFVILFVLIALITGLTWIVPSGKYETKPNDEGKEVPIAGTYKGVDKVTTEKNADGKEVKTDRRQGLWELAKAPITGVVGDKKTDGAIQVMLFVLVVGGFLGVTMKTGALDAFFGAIIRRLKGNTIWLIPILMTLFALGGTTYGMAEETVAFYAVLVPLMAAAGFNGMTAALVIILGSGIGVMGSTVNPFSTGIASGFAGITIGEGLIERLIIMIVPLAIAIWFTMRYARKVQAGKFKDDSAILPSKNVEASLKNTPLFTARRKWVMAIFGLTFVTMVLAVIPWAFKFNIMFFENMLTWFKETLHLGGLLGGMIPLGDYWFNELSMLFLVATFVIALVYYAGNKQDEDAKVVDNFINGARDLLGVALIIGLARGITVIMTNGEIFGTVLHSGEQMLAHVSGVLLPALSFIVYLPLSFIIPSTSGLATASMPIMAPLADFAHVPRHLIVTAFAAAEGIVNLFMPIAAHVVGGLVLAKVSYATFIKRTWWLGLVFSAVVIIVLTVSALLVK